MAAEITHDEATWLVDALVSMATLCNRLEEKGMPDLQTEADEVHDHIRDLVISLLEGKSPFSYAVTTSPAYGNRNVVTC